jgi:hypothetical protein
VANIFGSIIGKIQENMLKMDIQQVNQYGDTFFNSSDTAYLIFMVIGIVGYFTVPSVASYIVHASGANALLYKTTSLVSSGAQSTVSKTIGGSTSMVTPSTSIHASRSIGGGSDQSNSGYMHDKLSGK